MVKEIYSCYQSKITLQPNGCLMPPKKGNIGSPVSTHLQGESENPQTSPGIGALSGFGPIDLPRNVGRKSASITSSSPVWSCKPIRTPMQVFCGKQELGVFRYECILFWVGLKKGSRRPKPILAVPCPLRDPQSKQASNIPTRNLQFTIARVHKSSPFQRRVVRCAHGWLWLVSQASQRKTKGNPVDSRQATGNAIHSPGV